LASHTISSHLANKFVTFLLLFLECSTITLTSISRQHRFQIPTHRCALMAAEATTRLIRHLTI
jgi:hypothetical protein